MENGGTAESQAAKAEKSTGSLKAPTAPLGEKPVSGAQSRAERLWRPRFAELVTFLAAVIGAVALGLGITDYFADHPYVSAYLVAYAGFCLADLLVREDSEMAQGRTAPERRVIDQLPLLLLFAAAPFERTYLYGGEAQSWIAALGLLLELAGLWLALGSRIQLGFFSADENRPERPRLVRSGFYRHIRHPIYAGEFLVLLAWSFEYAAPIVAIVTLIVGIIVGRKLIAADEAAMLSQFGDEYAAYMRETDSVIPSLW
jgi:protein-S-isoprenylcysteine O-methyltransferase Ste14